MNRFRIFPAALAFATVFLAIEASAHAAFAINPTFLNSAGETWTTTRRNVINTAISNWEAKFTGIDSGSATVNVTFDFTYAGSGGYLGQYSGGFSAFPGADVRPWSSGVNHTIHFNVDLFSGSNYTWWDASPTDDGSDKPFPAWDAVSVARHEIGHMLGFTTLYADNFATGSETDPWEQHIAGNVFDTGGLNVAMSAGDPSHTLGSPDLMDPLLSNIDPRQKITSTHVAMLALAYEYQAAAFLAADFDEDGDVDGDDFLAWQTGFGTTTGATHGNGDANNDGDVDGNDFLVWQTEFGSGGGGGAGGGAVAFAVPEPGSALLLLVMVGAGVYRRW